MLVSTFLESLPDRIIDCHLGQALAELERSLKRPPRVADLNWLPLTRAFRDIESGFPPVTVRHFAKSIRRLARLAVDAGRLEAVPKLGAFRRKRKFKSGKARPLSPGELTRLISAARALPGEVAGKPAASWWKALALLSVDGGLFASALLTLPGQCFDRSAGTVVVKGKVRRLHRHTTAALAELQTADRPLLFPWDADPNGAPYYVLYADFRKLLRRARLPKKGAMTLFRRLAITRKRWPNILDEIDMSAPWRAPSSVSKDAPTFHKPPRRTRSDAGGELGKLETNRKRAKRRKKPEIRKLDSPRTIAKFYETVYLPKRHADSPESTRESYRSVIRRLEEFDGQTTLVESLDDDLIEGFIDHYRKRGTSPDTLSKYMGTILAVARFAFSKRWTEYQPRDITPVRRPRRVPIAFSVDQVDALLHVAGRIEGTIEGVPANLWWTSFLKTLWETGLRVHAALSLRTEDFDGPAAFVTARAETQKTRMDQCLAIRRETADLILSTCPRRRALLWPWPYRSKGPLYRRFHALLRMAQIPVSRKHGFHAFRKSTASYLTAAFSIEVAKAALGHRSESTTRAYLDPRLLPKSRTVDSLPVPTWRPQGLIGMEAGR